MEKNKLKVFKNILFSVYSTKMLRWRISILLKVVYSLGVYVAHDHLIYRYSLKLLNCDSRSYFYFVKLLNFEIIYLNQLSQPTVLKNFKGQLASEQTSKIRMIYCVCCDFYWLFFIYFQSKCSYFCYLGFNFCVLSHICIYVFIFVKIFYFLFALSKVLFFCAEQSYQMQISSYHNNKFKGMLTSALKAGMSSIINNFTSCKVWARKLSIITPINARRCRPQIQQMYQKPLAIPYLKAYHRKL